MPEHTVLAAESAAIEPTREERLKTRLLDRMAESLAARGMTRIALYGAGQHSRPILRQPWAFHGIEVVALLDDTPNADSVEGVPVRTPDALAAAVRKNPGEVSGIVISSEAHEVPMLARATALFAPLGIPCEPIYWSADDTDAVLRSRLQTIPGLEPRWIEWLIVNRGERHDATLPMLHPSRTELHRRRYELAAEVFRNAGVRGAIGDLASGTGYGTRVLSDRTGCEAVGVELDPVAVEYATHRYGVGHGLDGVSGGPRVSFLASDATRTGLGSGSLGAIASFETVEHVEDAEGLIGEFARLLVPGGWLLISTPNEMGPTPYHVHDFDFASFAGLLERGFAVERWLGQRPDDRVHPGNLPAGMFDLDERRAVAGDWDPARGRPDFLIAVCRKTG